MEFIEPFVFRTGLPFGYLLFASGLLVFCAVGLRFLWRGLHTQPLDLIRSAGGGAMVAVVVLVIVVNVVHEKLLDFNPNVTAENLSGAWREGHASLLIRANGRYSCKGGDACDVTGAQGSWRTEGSFDLAFTPDEGTPRRMRVVRYGHDLRLIEDLDDPDLWNGRLTFRKTANLAP